MANINISTILVKRGNTAAASAYVGPLGELLVDTGKQSIRVQDGATPGGMSTLATEQQVSNVIVAIEGLQGNTANISALLANIHGANISSLTSNVTLLQGQLSANGNATIGNLIVGNIRFESNSYIWSAEDGQIQFSANGYNDQTGIYLNDQDVAVMYANTDVQLNSSAGVGGSSQTWTFDRFGNLTLPGNVVFADTTIQSTAYQGPAGQTSFATVANVTTANVALKGYVDTKFALLANAPAILDTLGQIATAIQADEANIGTLLTNLTTTNANITAANIAWQANAVTQLSQITAANSAIVTVQANIGSYYTWANANVAGLYNSILGANANAVSQQSSINTINANITGANLNISALQSNIGSFYAYANLAYGTSSYANANVAGYLAGNVTIGNVTSTYFIGNGSKLTNVTAQYLGASQVTGGYNSGTNAGYITLAAAGLIQSASYALTLATSSSYPGSNNINISPGTGGNVVLQGNIVAAGNIFYASGFNATANVTAPNFLYPNGVSILTGISGTYSNTQVAAYLLGNISTGNVGVASGSWVDFRNTDTNWRMGYGINAYSKTTAITSLDVVVGSGTGGPDGFTVGQTNGASIFELVGSTRNAWFANNVTAVGNVTAGNVLATGFFYANGTPFTSSSYGNTQVSAYLSANPPAGTYSNTNVVAYLTTQTFYSNANVAAYLVSNPQGSTYSNANVVANLQNLVTNVVTTANVQANYFVGNGSSLTGLTYASVGNIYGSSSNVTLQAGSYSWTFDNTGNLTIPTTSNIVYANGTVFTSGTGSGGTGTNYSNANVVAMLSANTAVFIGNVGNVGLTGNIQANATAIFLGANTVISNYGSPTFGYATHIGNNVYFDANGVMRYRNTQTGASDLLVSPGTLNWYATGGAVTANTATGYTGATSLYMAISTSGMSLYNGAGLVSSGAITIQNATGLVTNQATTGLFQNASTINAGTAAGLLVVGSSTTNVTVGSSTVQSGNSPLVLRATGVYNTVLSLNSAGGYGNQSYTGIATTGGSGTGMIVTIVGATSGYLSSATVTNPGTGYKNGDTITIPASPGNGGSFVLQNYNSAAASGTGTANYTFSYDGNLALPGNVSHAGNSFIYGDFTNSTVNYRTIFAPLAANSNPGIYAAPSGTGTAASWQASNSRDLTNTSKILIATNGTTDVQLVSGINGSGTYLPLSFYTNGSNQMQLGTAGNLSMVTGGNIATTGNVIAGNIIGNQYGNSIGTSATFSGNVTAGNLVTSGYGYFAGAFNESDTRAGVFIGNVNQTPRVGFFNGVTSQNWEIDNSNGTFRWYTPGVTQMQLDPGGNLTLVNGNATIAGNLTVNGTPGITQPNRTAFRVYGQGSAVALNANVTASNWTVDYQQGAASTALNGSTGIFTAPVAGLYQTSLTARTTSNTNGSIIQAAIRQKKSGSTSVASFIEWGVNTTFNHASTSTVVKLAAGDQLWVQCVADGGTGGFSFDGNDHWDVVFLG